MNKRGQFFLVAALAIIGILIGLAAHYSSAETPPSDTVVYDLSKEINYESGQVIDHGVFYSLSPEQMNKNIENITDHYARTNPGTDFIFIYGDKSKVQVTNYQSSSVGSIGMDFGSNSLSLDQSSTGKNTTSVPLAAGDETVTLNLDEGGGNITYSFNLKPGQTFFVLLKKEKQGERYIATSSANI
jgi:hypothetical protein